MPDSIYDQALDIVAGQLKTLADAVDANLTPENAITPRRFDWQDIQSFDGVTLRYLDEPQQWSTELLDTNAASNSAYPMFMVCSWNSSMYRDDRTKKFHQFIEDVRKYYHHQRRLDAVSVTGVRVHPTTVRDGGPDPPTDWRLNKTVKMLTIIGWFLQART